MKFYGFAVVLILFISNNLTFADGLSSLDSEESSDHSNSLVSILGEVLRTLQDNIKGFLEALWNALPRELKDLVENIIKAALKVLFPWLLSIMMTIWSIMIELGKAFGKYTPEMVEELKKLPTIVQKGRFVLAIKMILKKVHDNISEIPEFIFQEVLGTVNRRKEELEEFVDAMIDLIKVSFRGFLKRLKPALQRLIHGHIGFIDKNYITFKRFIYICLNAPAAIINEFMNEWYEQSEHFYHQGEVIVKIGQEFTQQLAEDLVKAMVKGVGKVLDEVLVRPNLLSRKSAPPSYRHLRRLKSSESIYYENEHNMDVFRTLKDVMTLKFKPRHDHFSDQFNRIFMTKMLLIASFIMGVDYFSDSVNCMIPGDTKHSNDYFQAACWITGFYVFDEMKYRLDESSFYGIPRRMDFDGISYQTGKLCRTKDIYNKDHDCRPMTRLYYLQFQWMPIYIAALGIFYYLPYVGFRMANVDIVRLKEEVVESAKDTTYITRNYFCYSVNSVDQMRIRVLWNIIVKILYLFFGLSAFYITDHVLLGNYVTYGFDYLNWSEQNNTLKHSPVSKGIRAYAGSMLLPSMGYCDVHEASLEVRSTFHNENRFICEISPHILYQYVLMVLWFFFIASICISCLGLFAYIVSHLMHLLPRRKNASKQKILSVLTFRELEYLEIIKDSDMDKYSDVLKLIKQDRFGGNHETNEEGMMMTEGLDKYLTSLA